MSVHVYDRNLRLHPLMNRPMKRLIGIGLIQRLPFFIDCRRASKRMKHHRFSCGRFQSVGHKFHAPHRLLRVAAVKHTGNGMVIELPPGIRRRIPAVRMDHINAAKRDDLRDSHLTGGFHAVFRLRIRILPSGHRHGNLAQRQIGDNVEIILTDEGIHDASPRAVCVEHQNFTALFLEQFPHTLHAGSGHAPHGNADPRTTGSMHGHTVRIRHRADTGRPFFHRHAQHRVQPRDVHQGIHYHRILDSFKIILNAFIRRTGGNQHLGKTQRHLPQHAARHIRPPASAHTNHPVYPFLRSQTGKQTTGPRGHPVQAVRNTAACVPVFGRGSDRLRGIIGREVVGPETHIHRKYIRSQLSHLFRQIRKLFPLGIKRSAHCNCLSHNSHLSVFCAVNPSPPVSRAYVRRGTRCVPCRRNGCQIPHSSSTRSIRPPPCDVCPFGSPPDLPVLRYTTPRRP